MEHQLWKSIVALVRTLDKPPTSTRFGLSDGDIVAVCYGSVLCDRPASWACRKAHWPIHRRARPLPSPATTSRRLRSPSVVALPDALERRGTAPKEPGLSWVIGGKPLPAGGCPSSATW